jgi:hypothetical protein
VSAEWVYNGFDRWNHRRTHSVGIPVSDSTSESVTSLYGYPGLNPSVILSVKSAENNPRHHIVATFQKNCIVCRWYSRYIPMEVFCRYIPIVSLTDVLCRYIPTDFERELCPSVKISDEKISQVIPLVFSNFLVVVEVDYHFVRDRVAKKEIQIRFISSHD